MANSLANNQSMDRGPRTGVTGAFSLRFGCLLGWGWIYGARLARADLGSGIGEGGGDKVRES